MKIIWIFLALLVLCMSQVSVRAAEKPAEADDDDDAHVETESAEAREKGDDEGETEGEESEEDQPQVEESAPDVATRILFLEPQQLKPEPELHANRRVRFLVGFASTGAHNYTVHAVEASFRYPQDYSYHIANYSERYYQQEVGAGQHATFEYMFVVNEQFGGRPFGLTVTIYYSDRDDESRAYHPAVFNSTINVLEEDISFDSETFFIYIFFLAVVTLVVVLIYHYFLQSAGKRIRSSKSRDRADRPKPAIETGTQGAENVEMDWIPQHVKNAAEKAKSNGAVRERSKKRKELAGVFEGQVSSTSGAESE